MTQGDFVRRVVTLEVHSQLCRKDDLRNSENLAYRLLLLSGLVGNLEVFREFVVVFLTNLNFFEVVS